MSPKPGRVVVAALLLAAMAMGAVLAFRLDISATRFLRSDLVLREATYDPSLERCPMDDRSGYAVWAPAHQHLRQSLRTPELPLWNRMQGGGYSTLAELQPGVAFPLKWVVALVPAWSAESILIIASLVTSFLGAFFLLSGRAVSTVAAVAAGLFYAGSVHQLTFTHLGGIPFSLAPWVAWAALRLAERGRFGDLALTAGLVALLPLSGHPLLSASSGLAALIIVLPAVGWRRDALGKLGLAAALGLGLAAFVLLPFVDGLAESWTYKTATAEGRSYRALRFTEWLRVLGSAVVWPEAGRELDRAPSYDYLGVPVVVLAAFGIVGRRLRFLLVAVPVALVLAIPGPWMARLGDLAPLRYFKPSYLFVTLALAVACAVGGGVDEVRARHPRAAPVALALALVATLGANLYLVRQLLAPTESRWLPPTPALAQLQRDRDHRITGLWGQVHGPNLATITGVEDLRGALAIMNLRYHRWFEVIDPLILERTYPTMRVTPSLGSSLFGAFNVRYFLRGKVPFRMDHSALSPHETKVFPPELATIEGPTVRRVYADDGLEIYENLLDVRPRAYLAQRIETVAGMEAAATTLSTELVRAPSAPLDRDVVEAADPALAARLAALGPARGTAAVTYPGQRHAHIEVNTDREALLVLNDTYAPGWSAEIDGTAAEIVPVNLISRGVIVPAGKHVVQMSFWPPGLTEGLMVSGFSALVLLLIGVRARSKPRGAIG